jgi:signal recognition particle subunit SRP54
MGDVLTLIERAQSETTEEETQKLQEKMLGGSFNLEDFLSQLQQIKRMGPLSQILEMIPGIGQAVRQHNEQIGDDEFKNVEAMIHSMTFEERRHPEIIKPSRRKRIAAGSGTTQAEVNQLLNQFKQMQKMMEQMGNLGGGKRGGKLRGLLSGNPLGGMNPQELEAMMQGNGGMPALGRGTAPARPAQQPRKKANKKKKAKRRR